MQQQQKTSIGLFTSFAGLLTVFAGLCWSICWCLPGVSGVSSTSLLVAALSLGCQYGLCCSSQTHTSLHHPSTPKYSYICLCFLMFIYCISVFSDLFIYYLLYMNKTLLLISMFFSLDWEHRSDVDSKHVRAPRPVLLREKSSEEQCWCSLLSHFWPHQGCQIGFKFTQCKMWIEIRMGSIGVCVLPHFDLI